MIRHCAGDDFDIVFEIINDAAQAYKGIIPADRWKEPYMPKHELQEQIQEGVEFWGEEEAGQLVGVMGIQPGTEVTLIRHAYVRTAYRQRGVGGRLLAFLLSRATNPVLIGTWADATWAIDFYLKHGFALVTPQMKDLLLRKYWSIPERQVETSVVLADRNWFESETAPPAAQQRPRSE
jgi:N-acetylglutamate synthase-like GNAT family acetyltransferase